MATLQLVHGALALRARQSFQRVKVRTEEEEEEWRGLRGSSLRLLATALLLGHRVLLPRPAAQAASKAPLPPWEEARKVRFLALGTMEPDVIAPSGQGGQAASDASALVAPSAGVIEAASILETTCTALMSVATVAASATVLAAMSKAAPAKGAGAADAGPAAASAATGEDASSLAIVVAARASNASFDASVKLTELVRHIDTTVARALGCEAVAFARSLISPIAGACSFPPPEQLQHRPFEEAVAEAAAATKELPAAPASTQSLCQSAASLIERTLARTPEFVGGDATSELLSALGAIRGLAIVLGEADERVARRRCARDAFLPAGTNVVTVPAVADVPANDIATYDDVRAAYKAGGFPAVFEITAVGMRGETLRGELLQGCGAMLAAVSHKSEPVPSPAAYASLVPPPLDPVAAAVCLSRLVSPVFASAELYAEVEASVPLLVSALQQSQARQEKLLLEEAAASDRGGAQPPITVVGGTLGGSASAVAAGAFASTQEAQTATGRPLDIAVDLPRNVLPHGVATAASLCAVMTRLQTALADLEAAELELWRAERREAAQAAHRRGTAAATAAAMHTCDGQKPCRRCDLLTAERLPSTAASPSADAAASLGIPETLTFAAPGARSVRSTIRQFVILTYKCLQEWGFWNYVPLVDAAVTASELRFLAIQVRGFG
jgi:hypothetical protein